MKKNYLTLLNSSIIATGLTLGTAISAQAFTLVFDGSSASTNNPATGASATADFDFFDNATTGKVDLKITIDNTTGQIDPAFGFEATESTLVGLAFDLPGIIDTGVYDNLTSDFNKLFIGNLGSDINSITAVSGVTVSNQDATLNGNVGNGSKNKFEIGFRPIGGGNFNGGNPQGGVTAGESTMVQFSFTTDTPTTAEVLEQAFLTELSSDNFTFGARFQQVNGGDNENDASDKLIGGTIVNPDPENNEPNEPQEPMDVPEPGTIFGLSLFTLAAAKFAKKKK